MVDVLISVFVIKFDLPCSESVCQCGTSVLTESIANISAYINLSYSSLDFRNRTATDSMRSYSRIWIYKRSRVWLHEENIDLPLSRMKTKGMLKA